MKPFSPSHERVLARNNVRVTGAGPRTLVFAHGFGCDQNMWRFVAPAFERDHRIVLFDYVGSGQSDPAAFDAERYRTLDGYAQDLVEICEALDLQGAVLVGHSVSAMIGVLAAARQPQRFSKLVMISPSPRYIDDPPHYVGGFSQQDITALIAVMDHNYVGWAQQLAPVIMSNPERPELTAELERSFCSTDPVAARAFANATFYADNRADLAGIALPTLIVQVSDDAVASMEVGEYLHRRIAGSTFVVIDGHGHCPHMSHPTETVHAIRQYLDRGHGH